MSPRLSHIAVGYPQTVAWSQQHATDVAERSPSATPGARGVHLGIASGRSHREHAFPTTLSARRHARRLTTVRRRGPHPASGEALAPALRGARSRGQRRLPRAYAPSECGHPARTPPGRLCLAGRRDSLNHETDLLNGSEQERE